MASHNRAVESPDPVSSLLVSSEWKERGKYDAKIVSHKHTQWPNSEHSQFISVVHTAPLCPLKVPARSPLSENQRFTVLSLPQVIRKSPSLVNLHVLIFEALNIVFFSTSSLSLSLSPFIYPSYIFVLKQEITTNNVLYLIQGSRVPLQHIRSHSCWPYTRESTLLIKWSDLVRIG